MLSAHLLPFVITTALLSSYLVQGTAPRKSVTSPVYVRPPDTVDCGGKTPCHMLQEYLKSWKEWFISDRMFYFLPGSHTVNETLLLTLTVSNLSLSGTTATVYNPAARIQCEGALAFHFLSSEYLKISDLAFIGCGSADPKDSNHAAALILNATQHVMLKNAVIEESYGYGVLGVNVFENFSMVNCVFSAKQEGRNIPSGNVLIVYSYNRNSPILHTLTISHCTFRNGVHVSRRVHVDSDHGDVELKPVGGGGLGIFVAELQQKYPDGSIDGDHDPIIPDPSVMLMLSVHRCMFYNNSAPMGANMLIVWRASGYRGKLELKNNSFYNGRASSKGGGIYIETQQDHYSPPLDINIMDSLFLSNSAKQGGALAIDSLTDTSRSLKADDMTVLKVVNCTFCNNFATEGGGIYAELKATLSSEYIPIWRILGLIITHCTLKNNSASRTGGGAYINLHPSDKLGLDVVTDYIARQYNLLVFMSVSASEFEANIGDIGSALAVVGNDSKEALPFLTFNEKSAYICHTANIIDNITIEAVTFRNNIVQGTIKYNSAALYISNIENTFLKTSNFTNNRGSAIYANTTSIHLSGKNNFVGNAAHSGGALYLDCSPLGQSIIYLGDKDTNVYISSNRAMQYGGAVAISERCDVYSQCFIQYTPPTLNQTILENNSAVVAGDSLYGGSLKYCPHMWDLGMSNSYSASDVSSPAYKICFCTGNLKGEGCKNESYMEVFPGETFQVSATTVGQFEGASPAVVRTNIISAEGPAQLGLRQNVQDLGRGCGELTFSVLTAARKVELHLEVESILGSQYTPSVVTVVFQDCPFGFQLSETPPFLCNCMPHISTAGVKCNISTQTIHRPANMWIGNYSGGIAVHSNCPFDYCKLGNINISLWSQDEQCAHINHSGVLCGQCKAGLSAALGTSQCLHCSNRYLLLLLPFALAGVLLVLILFCCNLTVSMGTVNGLIFYVNIIRVNHAIFFPQGDTTIITNFLGIFIAWLNLDLGFKACFINGMDTYTKIWLQFVFPVYVWILAGIIIYSSRYSFIVSRIAGSNSVPVLATLFLLSFAKLLRTIIAAVSPITLVIEQKQASLVWLLDGNVPYLKGRHAALFVMALLATTLYIIPFTVFVLFSPCLQAHSDYKVLRWVNKLKPLLDAYQGPYRDRFRYWTGLMLAVRIFLFTIFAANALGDPRVNLLAIVSAMLGIPIILSLYNTGGVYKKHVTHIVEAFFVLNLTILAAATLLLKVSKASPRSQEIVTAVLVASAFIVFCVIAIYHICEQIKKVDALDQLFKGCFQKILPQSVWKVFDETIKGNSGGSSLQTRTTFARNAPNAPELREPLLEDC